MSFRYAGESDHGRYPIPADVPIEGGRKADGDRHVIVVDLPAMGQRLRLRPGFDVSSFPRQSRVVLRALKRYGAIVADNGSAWYVSGAPSRGWNNDDLHSLQRVRGSYFQVVDSHKLKRPRR